MPTKISTRAGRLAGAALAMFAAIATTNAAAATSRQQQQQQQELLLPRGVKLPAGVVVPNDTALAIYMPPGALDARSYLATMNLWIEPGRALEEARGEGAQKLFPRTIAAAPGGAGQYGLLLVVHPDWGTQGAGMLRLEMKYRLYDPQGKLLREGSQVQSGSFGTNISALRALAHKTLQFVLVDVLRQVKPSDAGFPATGELAAIAPATLVRRDKPAQTGTAFVVNAAGQLLTAAHVVRNCTLLEAQKDGETFPVTSVASSDLLDLAVLDSGRPATSVLPFREGNTLVLGESVTNVGYPLSGLLATTPNVTRGNVSARAGLKGSVGLFQFSAPIQPGASGGPVVSDGGELLGVTVGTLNVGALVQQGLLPQNVNFALDARHAAAFLRERGIDHSVVAARSGGSMQVANDAALASVVQLSCLQ